MTRSPLTWHCNLLVEAVGLLYGFTARYRPDGMRAQKVNGLQLGANYTEENEVSGYYDVWSTDKPTTRYHYEGQMPFGEDFTYKEAGVDRQRATVYVPGLRGTDGVRVTLDGAETAVGWPLYDTHGNNVGMVRQAAGTGFTLGDERRYDAWGAAVWTSGDPPAQGYCGSLGHRADGESSLVYMRARYYEPWNGRFISEDPARDGYNWYAYCDSNPLSFSDPGGTVKFESLQNALLCLAMMMTAAINDPTVRWKTAADVSFLVGWWTLSGRDYLMNAGVPSHQKLGALMINFMIDFIVVCLNLNKYEQSVKSAISPTAKIVFLCMEHASFILLFLELEAIGNGSR